MTHEAYIGPRIHGWLAPLVDAATLAAVEQAQANSTHATMDTEARVLVQIAKGPTTTMNVARVLGISDCVVRSTMRDLVRARRIECCGRTRKSKVWRAADSGIL